MKILNSLVSLWVGRKMKKLDYKSSWDGKKLIDLPSLKECNNKSSFITLEREKINVIK